MARKEGTHITRFIGRLKCLDSDPTGDARTGEVYYNTSENRIHYFDGTNWIATGAMTTSTSTSTSTSSTSTSSTSTSVTA